MIHWKYEKLIRLLLKVQPQTAQALAEHMNVSIRSIKNYVHEINKEYPSTISSSHEGYAIEINKAISLLNEQDKNIPQTSKERVIYILNQLLHPHNNETINIYDLSDAIFISLSTLKNELKKVKRRLSSYDLELITHGDVIYMKGLEKNKRKLLSTILYEESNINFINIDSLQKAFVSINIAFIKRTVLEIFAEYHYYINDYSLINLVLHITIAIDRIRNQNVNIQALHPESYVKLHEYQLAQQVANRLEAYFNITYSDAEVYEMTLLIISRATTIDYKSINISNLEEFIEKDCLLLVNQLIKDINKFYYIDLSEPEFFIRFALHIRNLLVRSKNNYFSKNPLTQVIKTSCPMIYDISVSLAGTMKEKANVTINDDEISYIAFHLGSMIEAQKNRTKQISAILYCPSYYDMNLRIIDKINTHFLDSLLITHMLTDESEFNNIQEVDLIITTLPLVSIYAIPTLQIHPFFFEKDQLLLKEKIQKVRHQKKKREFESYLRELIIPNFFEKNNTIKNQAHCVSTMVDKMVRYKYVDPNFAHDIFEREEMSSTAYGLFAIPHAMKMCAHKTGINILLSNESIDWNGTPVHLVLMMCFNANDRFIFNEIFDPITLILSENENIKRILACSTYEEFIQKFVSLL